MTNLVQVRELAAWGFDDYPYRPASQPKNIPAVPAHPADPRLPHLIGSLAPHALRPDLQAEMQGFAWSLGAVDLRLLQAFQRRLSLSDHHATRNLPAPNDWSALVDFALAPPRPIHYQLDRSANIITTADPNLHLRTSSDPAHPFILHGGSPFLEVACYRNRWFLRDGYHRAYALLKRNIFAVPAVILTVSTLADLGADASRFFPESVLFSAAPPLVHHFLDEACTITYPRPALRKTIRLTIEETFTPIPPGEPA